MRCMSYDRVSQNRFCVTLRRRYNLRRTGPARVAAWLAALEVDLPVRPGAVAQLHATLELRNGRRVLLR